MKTKSIRIITLVVMIMLCLATVCVNVFADSDMLYAVSNSVEIDGTNDATVSVSISATDDISLLLIQGTWTTTEVEGGNYFTLAAITTDTSKIEFDGTNNDCSVNSGYLVWLDETYEGVSFAKDEAVITATYKVAANTPVGTYTVKFTPDVYCDVDETEYYDVFTFTIEVKEPAPACTHESTKLVPNTDGTHNVVCANTECGETVTSNVTCTGTDDNNCTTAVFCGCGNEVTAAKEHGHTLGFRYDNPTATTHDVYCLDCQTTVDTGVEHDYTYDATNHKCICDTVETFTISMQANGGKFSNGAPSRSVSSFYGDFLENYSNPTRDGYTFAGWNTAADGSGEDFDPTTYKFTENVTVYAQWTENHVCADNLTHNPKSYGQCDGGYNEYWTCSCGKNYADAAATTEITDLAAWKAEDGAGYLKPEHFPAYSIYGETHQLECAVCKTTLADEEPHDYTTGKADHTCKCNDTFTGWEDKCYYENAVKQTGWTEIDSAWYYLDPTSGVRAEGLTRVPYPTVAINGITYAPDAEAMAYCAANDTTFIDAEKAWFLFGDDGKFTSTDYTDIYTNGTVTMFIEDGMGVWHPGLVLDGTNYYYFTGDLVNGGNKLATGDVYVVSNATDREVTIGGIYTFNENGILIENNGIVNGRYYENAQLMIGNGLTKVGDNYIYVRSNGQVVMDAEYYVPANDLGIVSGLYSFDENGYLVNPKSTDVNGVVNGYYYVNGKIQYGAGLIEYNDGFIYVCSNGQVATGKYWVTNTNGHMDPARYEFDENGMMLEPKNGIVEVEGVLYYYENNHIQYGAGLIEYNQQYIYVRSNGQVATGKYWVTNTNGLCDPGYIVFGEDGYKLGE